MILGCKGKRKTNRTFLLVVVYKNNAHCLIFKSSSILDPCPENWQQIELGCYLFVKDYALFSNAEQNCRNLDAELFEPDDAEVNNHVFEAARSENMGCSWVGITDIEGQGNFVYNSDYTEIVWTNWLHETSHPADGLQCVAEYATNHGKWVQENCENNFHQYICQKFV